MTAAIVMFLGLWAVLLPDAFATFIEFPPYNKHLLHDAGVFQIAIGATVFLGLRWRDPLAVAIGGFTVAGLLHTIVHVIDASLGGRPFDPLALAALPVLAIVGFTLVRRSSG